MTDDTAEPTLEAEGHDDAGQELPPRITSLLDDAATARSQPALRPDAVAAAGMSQLGLGFVLEVRELEVLLKVGASMQTSPLGTVHPAVLRTACERGEPVLIERSADGSVRVVGALRTQPSPGVDAMEEVTIEADRIHLRGQKEVTLESGAAARIALRAVGEIETYASRILSKAEEVHKIVGRMLRLN